VRVTPECDTLSSFTISNASRVQKHAATVFNGENYIVLWTDERFVNDSFYVVTTRVTPEGSVLGSGVRIGYGNGHQREYYPAVAFDGDRCLAVWTHYYEPYGIYGRFINSSGQPVDKVIPIATTATYYFTYPKIAFDGTNYFVVFVDRPGSYYNIYGQLISPDGSLIGSRIEIAADDITQYIHDVTWDSYSYLIVWKENNNIKGQYVDTNGQLIGSSFLISDNTSYSRNRPGIAASNTNHLIAWYEYREPQPDIYGNVDQIIGIEEKKILAQSAVANRLCHTSPNLFTSRTQVSYTITRKGKVNLAVFDVLGQKIKVLVNEEQGPGHYEVTWNARDERSYGVCTGVYFVRLVVADFTGKAGGFSETQKLTLIH
jgi:hypothetical protein